jgi:hypothetical protein
MTMARAKLVDTETTRWYHCITRCVRCAFLLAEGTLDRKQWLENRLRELAEIFAISVGGFSILDDHLHVLVRLDPAQGAAWSDEEVVRQWGRLFPPRDRSRQPLPVSTEWGEQKLKDPAWVETARQRLRSLSWFMKCWKEPLSRLVNQEENARGAYFEGRVRSIATLDEESLLATCAYIDLNPVAAGVAPVPEANRHTSVQQRVAHTEGQDRNEDLKAAEQGSVAAQRVSGGLEDAHWLCPIEDRQRLDSPREGMVESFTLGNDLLLVDDTGRLLRQGKATLSRDLAGNFERLGTDVET